MMDLKVFLKKMYSNISQNKIQSKSIKEVLRNTVVIIEQILKYCKNNAYKSK